MSLSFEYKIIGFQDYDQYDDNIDIEIALSNGNVYSATLFTLQNLATLMRSYEQSGECGSGTYVWSVNMIIVKSLNDATIRKTITGLLESGEISDVCLKIR